MPKRLSKQLKESVLGFRSLDNKEKIKFKQIEPYLLKKDQQELLRLIKQKRARISMKRYGWSFLISGKDLLPTIISKEKKARDLNQKIKDKFYETRFEEFTERVWNALPHFIAPSLIGQLHIKQTIALQMVSTVPINILIRGDDEISKEKIMKSARRVAPLSIIYKHGQEEPLVTRDSKGVLFKASNSVVSITDIEKLEEEQQILLAHSLESKKSTSSLIATTKNLDRQMPISKNLAAQFNLIFYMRPTALTAFKDIAEKIIMDETQAVKKVDVDFFRRYFNFSKQLDIKIPAHLSQKIKDFTLHIKEKEEKLPYPITPNTVKGIVEMIKASARLELRTLVELKDLERVFNIFEKATEVPPPAEQSFLDSF